MLARLVLLLALLPAIAIGGEVAREVGETTVQVLVPDGFVNAADVSPDVQRIAETMTLRGNRTLMFMVSEADVARIRGRERGAEIREVLSIQYPLRRERDRIDLSYFSALKQYLKENGNSLLSRATPRAQQQLEDAGKELGSRLAVPDLKMKLGESIPLGPFDERTNSISLAAVIALDFTAHGSTEPVPTAMTMTVAVVKGKMLYLYAYVPYEQGTGVPRVRQLTLTWLDQFFAANAD